MLFVRFVVFFIASALVGTLQAQRYLGVATSNYGGIQSLYLNPANVSGSKLRFDFNLGSFNTTFANNIYTTNGSLFELLSDNDKQNAFKQLAQRFDVNTPLMDNVDYQQVKNTIISKSDYAVLPEVYASDERIGPSIMFDINHRWGFALTTRFINASNFIDQMESGETFQAFETYILKKALTAEAVSAKYNFGNFKSSSIRYAEMGLTLGTTLIENNAIFVKIGGTLKRYVGIETSLLNTLRTEVEITNIRTVPSVILQGELNTFRSYNPHLATSSSITDHTNYFFNGLLGTDSKIPNGWGFDGGLVFEYRPQTSQSRFSHSSHQYNKDFTNNNLDYTKSNYLFKISAAFTDIGYIDFSTDLNNLYATKISISQKQAYTFSNASNMLINSTQELVNLLSTGDKNLNSATITIDQSDKFKERAVWRPGPMFNFSVDYKFTENCYVSFNWLQNLLVKFTPGLRHHSLINITPRYESRHIDFGIPLTYNFVTKQFYWGLGCRISAIHFGMDNAIGSLTNFQSINIYGGIKISISKENRFVRFFNPHKKPGTSSFIRQALMGEENVTPVQNPIPVAHEVILSQEKSAPVLRSASLLNPEKKFGNQFAKDIEQSQSIQTKEVVPFTPTTKSMAINFESHTNPLQFQKGLNKTVHPRENEKSWLTTTVRKLFSRSKRSSDEAVFQYRYQPKQNNGSKDLGYIKNENTQPKQIKTTSSPKQKGISSPAITPPKAPSLRLQGSKK